MNLEKRDPPILTVGDHCNWKVGPLPADTWNWGGVVPKGMTGGFLFADFCGDHVKTFPDGKEIKAEDVAFYNNSLDLPPCCKGVGQRLESK